MSNNFIVAYGYQDKFEIDEKLAHALIVAKKARQEGVEQRGRFYSTRYLWIMPVAEAGVLKIATVAQMKEAHEIARWLIMPIHELGWTEEAAIEYASKLVTRVDLKELRALDRTCGYDGTYPNPRRFMMEAKQLSGVEGADTLALSEG